MNPQKELGLVVEQLERVQEKLLDSWGMGLSLQEVMSLRQESDELERHVRRLKRRLRRTASLTD